MAKINIIILRGFCGVYVLFKELSNYTESQDIKAE
jgi:hypothetical protein